MPRKMRLLEYIDEVIDENIEVQARKPIHLCGLGILEIDGANG